MWLVNYKWRRQSGRIESMDVILTEIKVRTEIHKKQQDAIAIKQTEVQNSTSSP